MTKNLDRVYLVFNRYYKIVPLEVFKNDPYQTLISTVLSSRTKDETTLESSKRLFKIASDINKLAQLSQNEIRNQIYPVGFYKTKARHLQKLARVIVAEYKSKIPHNKIDLISLPGVGIKTANLVLNRAFGIPTIAVDTHVHRISNMLGWVKTKTPEHTEKELVKIIPEKYWSDTNRLFVSIGRQFTTRKKLEEFLKKERLM